MKIDHKVAIRILREEADASLSGQVNSAWLRKIERLSHLCEQGVSKTHIAFLGTTILAKASDGRADLFAIKPEHAKDNENAYSARSLAHGVLVPAAAELGFSIGVTGREPLNNQPYFRMVRLDDGTPVHPGAKASFDYMLELVRELQTLPSEAEAREALRAYIVDRRNYIAKYVPASETATISPEQLTSAVQTLVAEASEGGRRAQAVAAGLFDLFAGNDNVESSRINDPSRRHPGDVCVRSKHGAFDKAVEVRDKPVKESDVQIFGTKCLQMGTREASVLMVGEGQTKLDGVKLMLWAQDRGLGLTLFYGWADFVDQILFWSERPKPEGAVMAVELIRQRLIGVEASPAALETWSNLTKARSLD